MDHVVFKAPRGLLAWTIGLVAFAGFGCGRSSPTTSPVSPAAGSLSAVARYLPVDDGAVYAYRTEDLVEKSSGVLMLRVRRRAGGGADLLGGARPQHVSFEANGIRREPSGFYLLRAPLIVGTEWPGGPGATARIVNADVTVRVPAGTFSHCVEVREERSGASRGEVRTTFCPDVGIVVMESQGAGPGGDPIHERYELRSFGKAVDLRLATPP